jgi:1-acyl-sn-glycerol-3-phosphate acyltransferase
MTNRGKAKEAFQAPTTGSALFEAFCKVFFRFYCRLTITGQRHLPPSPFIICSNHASHIDSAVLMTASGLPFSTFALLGASDYFFKYWGTKVLVSRFMNVIPIDRQARHKSLRRSLTMCNEFLRRTGGNLILYPEGTRSCNGEMQTFKKGAGLFAVDLGVPVVPAYIEGAHSILAKGKFMPWPEPVTVRFGQPIRFDLKQIDRAPRRTAVDLLEQRVRELSRRTSPEDQTRLPEQEERMILPISVSQSNCNTRATASKKS